MNLGLLDILVWPIAWLDHGLALLHIPALARILLWGTLAGTAGMVIYRRCSRQQTIAGLRVELATVQRAMAAHDGDFSDLWILIKRQLRLAFRQLSLSLLPALLAGLPPLLLLPWLSNQFDLAWPIADAPVRICAQPREAASGLHWEDPRVAAAVEGCWAVAWPAADASVSLREADRELLKLPTPAPVAIVHKREIFNLLIGNPAGYLKPTDPADAFTLELPGVEFIKVGPAWLRGYLPPFFFAVMLVSIWLRQRWKLY